MIALVALYKRHDEHLIITFRSVFKFQIPMSELWTGTYCLSPSTPGQPSYLMTLPTLYLI